MNLVLSGAIDDSLRNLVVALVEPRRVVRLHAGADRMEGSRDDASTRAEVATLCDGARVDHAYIEEGLRFSDFKLLAMDMDSTLITIECIDEIADFAGKKAEVSAITEAAMRGEMDFEESLRRRVAALAGLSEGVLRDVFEERLKLTAGAEALIRQAKTAGTHVMLVSGGFDYFADRLKEQLKLDEAHANHLVVARGMLTGQLNGALIDAATKARLTQTALDRLGAGPTQAMVIGDGANDVSMMERVAYSVAYHARQKTREAAKLQINFGDLSVVCDWLHHA